MRRDFARWLGLMSGFAAAGSLSGCSTDFLLNQTTERQGNVFYVFINNTPFRASFSFGTYDDLDRSPGPVALQQLRLEGNTTSTAVSVTCRRDAAVGTDKYVERVLITDSDNVSGFDSDAFGAVVNFSSAPQNSDAAALPTEGTAEGVSKRLGVDYSCNDQLVFTFEQDPDAPGGFRIDFTVIQDVDNQ